MSPRLDERGQSRPLRGPPRPATPDRRRRATIPRCPAAAPQLPVCPAGAGGSVSRGPPRGCAPQPCGQTARRTHGQVPRVAAPRGQATSRRAVRRARRCSRPPGLFVDRRSNASPVSPKRRPRPRPGRAHPPSCTPGGPPAQLARHSSATPALRHEEQDAVAGRCGRVHGARETSTISTPGPSLRRVHRMILTRSREYWSRYEDFA